MQGCRTSIGSGRWRSLQEVPAPPWRKEELMANQNNAPAPDKNEMRIMWIASAVIVVLLLGGMGINMLVHHEPSADFDRIQQPVAHGGAEVADSSHRTGVAAGASTKAVKKGPDPSARQETGGIVRPGRRLCRGPSAGRGARRSRPSARPSCRRRSVPDRPRCARAGSPARDPYRTCRGTRPSRTGIARPQSGRVAGPVPASQVGSAMSAELA